jgi:hypothetical protein
MFLQFMLEEAGSACSSRGFSPSRFLWMPLRKVDKVLIPMFFVVLQSSDWTATRRFPIVPSPGESGKLPENLLEDLC